jgi:glutamate N-acetyltransferase/amino-acid N-acetyltransferase
MTISLPLPRGFRAHVTNIGVKDTTADFTVVASEQPCTAAGVFTRSSFAGPSVLVSRAHVAHGTARAMVVISKNANVATGDEGRANAEEVAASVAGSLGIEAGDVLLASTGVIGRRYPMDRVRSHLATFGPPLGSTDATAVATAIMTTDTHPKVAFASAGEARVVGIAKGVGMIEPDMATMIAPACSPMPPCPATELDARSLPLGSSTGPSTAVSRRHRHLDVRHRRGARQRRRGRGRR